LSWTFDDDSEHGVFAPQLDNHVRAIFRWPNIRQVSRIDPCLRVFRNVSLQRLDKQVRRERRMIAKQGNEALVQLGWHAVRRVAV
jgi:hypothetical protein